MSDSEMTPISGNPPVPPPSPRRGLRWRLRRFFLLHLPLSAACAVAFFALLTAGLYLVAISAPFENWVRVRLIAQIEEMTGGRAEIASFHWRPLHLEADADGLVIHGLEDAGEAPYARIEHLRVHISLRNLFSPSIRLRSLDVDHPSLHFIVYPNGATNQPQPHLKSKPGASGIDTLFKLHVGRLSVARGTVHFESRASDFDYQDRYLPLDFSVDDLGLHMSYVAATRTTPVLYRMVVGATDLGFSRSLPRKSESVRGSFEATLDLERTRLSIRNLKIAAHGRGIKDHTLIVNAVLDDFTHPRWQATAKGDADLRLLDPVTGYTDVPEGIARLELSAGGDASGFHLDGGVHIDGASYTGKGINARDVNIDAWLHADPKQLLIKQIVAHMHPGGEIDGDVALSPWLPRDSTVAGQPPVPADRNKALIVPDAVIPMNGKVTAEFKDVTLDTILDTVSAPAYRRFGVDARVNGPATAEWTGGLGRNLSIAVNFALSPSGHPEAGESPAVGALDGIYTQRNGAVDLRRLDLHLPATTLNAHGQLGAYPITSPSGLAVEFRSRNLGEFDTLLRTLGYKRNGKSGSAALPATLAGEADFLGSWTGSLARPHLSGNIKAAQIDFEMPAADPHSAQARTLHVDSVEATGSYSPSQLSVQHAVLLRGKTRIAMNGTLDAAPHPSADPRHGGDGTLDANSILHAHFETGNLDLADVRPFLAANQQLPVQGVLNARLDASGPLRAPSFSGTVEMPEGSIHGEPVSHLRAQGTFSNPVLKLSSASAGIAGGTLTLSGSYDLKSRRFDANAHASGIEISRLGAVRDRNLEIAGKLTASVSGSGTPDDPHLEGRASLAAFTLRGQQFHSLEFTAHSANRALTYDGTAKLENSTLALHGQTQLAAGYNTQAQLEFSHFNIAALLKMAHVQAVTGDSSLAGTVTIGGPLAHPDQLYGEARLRELAVTVAGVKLKSEGGMHATLSGAYVHVDPLHIIGEDTDLRAQGILSLKGARQIDLSASGSVNLKLVETLDPALTASGTSTFQVQANGSINNPILKGRVDFQNGALSMGDLPNGLSQLHGTLEFNQNRLEVRSLTAVSGGGQISVGGYLAYQHGIYADLSATARQVRVRYPAGITSLADATLKLQGTQNNLLLSGNALITRFSASPDLDLTSFAAQTTASTHAIAPANAPSNHVRLDLHIASSPQLNFQNAFAKLAGNVDLRLRGTLASPSLLGRISIADGSAVIAGTRYELERGDIAFTNPVRIEPEIDLSATARVEDYDISLGLHGSPQKLAVTYRSDPPLPEADVVSLLALGHTSSQQRLYTRQQEQALSNSTDALLGGALNATVSSRMQKLFGAGSVKVDPNYLGAFGNSTSRVTVEEQIGRTVVLTYATNVNTTSQQLLQAEVAINRHISLVVARDESGVFSMVFKATRRYR